VRAAVLLALALSLGSELDARAAPAPGGLSTDNPFKDGSGGSEAGTGPGQPAGKPSPSAKAAGEREQEGEQPGDKAESAEGGEADDGAEDNALHGLACLEGDATGGRRKGVQRRDFLKRHRFELAAVGGWYASDVLSSTYDYGGALAFFPSEDFGLEVLVTRSPIRYRLEEPFSSFDLEHHFQGGVAWQGIFSLLWSPIHAKLKFSDTNIVHGDLFAVAGAGRTFHESVLGLTWEAGAGLKLYLSRFVTFRLDVRDFLLPQEVLGRGRITNNVTILAGISLWLG